MDVLRTFLSIAIAALAANAQPREIPNPALPGSGQSYLAISPEGRAYLSWTEPSGTGYRLQFAVWEDEAWRPAGRVAEGASWFVNWADYPTFLPMAGGALAAHWLEKSGSSSYSYGIKLAQLRTPSASWKIVFAPTVRKEGQYTGFASLVALAQGMGASYLAPGAGGGEEDKSLRFVRISGDGSVLADEMIDPDVCTCCQTSVALTEAGPIVAYRGHTAGEIRDISVVSYRDGKWLAPRPVHQDGWKINACPVNGPALAASGKRVWAAWYTAAGETPRMQIASSQDAGLTFSAPLRLDGGSPLGRVAVVLLPDGGAVGSWIEKRPEGRAELRVRRVSAGGQLGTVQTVAEVDAGRKTGFPKMVLAGKTLLMTWTADRIRTVAMAIPPI